MIPDVVVDVGNTRIKWGRCGPSGILGVSALPPDDPGSWDRAATEWDLALGTSWLLASVQPSRASAFAAWARARGDDVVQIFGSHQIPLQIELPQPDKVGIDRLLDAVAADSRRQSGYAAAIVDAGSAITVDLVDSNGVFRGGVILPGLRLMAKALHEHTALLPLVDIPPALPVLPATSTVPAMQAGILAAGVGGVRWVLEEYRRRLLAMEIYVTGGDAAALAAGIPGAVVWEEMTLEGMRLAAMI
jgi:type III pantothenate kinase